MNNDDEHDLRGADGPPPLPSNRATDLTLPLEVAAPDGGTYLLSQEPAPLSYRDGTSATLTLAFVPGPRTGRTRPGIRGALIGAPAVAILLWAATYVVASTGRDSTIAYVASALHGPCQSSFCFAPLGAFLGFALGSRLARPEHTAGIDARFESTVSIDGDDRGPLVDVESDVVTRSVLIRTTRGETKIELATAQDAVTLGDALHRLLLRRAKDT